MQLPCDELDEPEDYSVHISERLQQVNVLLVICSDELRAKIESALLPDELSRLRFGRRFYVEQNLQPMKARRKK